MGRPPKQRVICGRPGAAMYKPAGIPARELEWTRLTLDEFEAIRLVDGEGRDQEAAAAQMGVSRPTVTRILASGRAKVARVLARGQALVIEGGPVIEAPVGGPGPGRRGGGMGGRGRRKGRGRRGRRWYSSQENET